MNPRTKALKRLGLYCLLLAADALLYAEIIPDRFPTRGLSALYLACLCFCLVLY